MNQEIEPKILSQLTKHEFVGRDSEFEKLLQHAKSNDSVNGLMLLSAPFDGSSEILKQVYEELFEQQSEIVPFYFSVSKNDVTVENAVRRFLQSFLLQVVAFRRKDAKMLLVEPQIHELAEICDEKDSEWFVALIAACETESNLGDYRSFIRHYLSAPLRAAASGEKIFVMIDNLHHSEALIGETSLIDELKGVFSRGSVPFVFSGRRRYLLKAIENRSLPMADAKLLKLNSLSPVNAGTMLERLAQNNNVEVNAATRDLIVNQFHSNPAWISAVIFAARERGIKLTTYQNFEKIYISELLGGRIGRKLDEVFDEISENPETQKEIISLLKSFQENKYQSQRMSSWAKSINADDTDFYKAIRGLHLNEFIRLNSSQIENSDRDTVHHDYIAARFMSDVQNVPRTKVFDEMLAKSLKRAPEKMTDLLRKNSSIGLCNLLNSFDCQNVSKSFFNYESFRDKYKGLETAEILKEIAEESEKICLPQIVHTAKCVGYYPPIQLVCDNERCIVSLGFEEGNYLDENEVHWIAVEIDSKLEASEELTRFWCDRLEMAALMCDFGKTQIWIISPQGFSPEACALLEERGAYGSSRAQAELLLIALENQNLAKKSAKKSESKANFYEFVMPMSEDSEVIAANLIDELARRAKFQSKQLNQIKTAVVEACINAAEHSLSPDRRIHHKILIDEKKLEITITNRGIPYSLSKKKSQNNLVTEPAESRRGWGLKLMRKLMDEVSFERVDDGTSIKLVKYKN